MEAILVVTLRQHCPGHGEFVMLKTQPTDGSAPLEFSSKFGSRLWMSPDDELYPRYPVKHARSDN